MRIKSTDDLSRLGTNAKKQIEAALKEMGGIKNQKLADSANEYACVQKTEPVKPKSTEQTPDTGKRQKTKSKPSRVMRTESGATYCPWPSTDPFVSVIQRLEKKYGRYGDGGLVLTELIIDGGEKDWRFDIALLSPFKTVNISGSSMYIGKTCLIEADGFGFHRSKEAFKNDRAKQTHALKQGFAVKRITNEDARHRLDEVIEDIDEILSQPRLYKKNYCIHAKGKTQSVLRWHPQEEM